MPRSSPCAEGARCQCKVGLHGHRERKTGPGHPLAVVRCQVHGQSFTIYPSGFVPFGRQRLPRRRAEIESAPALLAVEDRADPEVTRWPGWADPDGVEPGWASTQWRQIGWWGRCLGLSESEAQGQRVAAVLGVPQHEHVAGRARYGAGGDRRRSQAVLAVLAAVGRAGEVLVRLLRAGQLVGLLGRAFGVDGLRRLRPLVPV
ncbi:hypothetical protein ACFL51_00495 [Myxococcota bacterium]